VSVDAEGIIYFDDRAQDHASLYARVAAYGKGGGELNVALECDGRLEFDHVVAVMDTIKKAGARNVAIRHNPL
jgi:biopolymer transport protein ExbD